MEFLFDYGLFLAKIATAIIAIVVLLVLVKSLNGKSGSAKGELEVTDLSEKYKDTITQLEEHLFEDDLNKARNKANKKEQKQKEKARSKAIKKASKDNDVEVKRDEHVFVLDFKGSIDAKEVTGLREEITAILSIAQPGDEVLLRLETGGGMVHGYGLASSQLDRLRNAEIPLTIAVDKVAASGGYMMACVANKIVAAPFAIVGSIGVIAQIPNFNKLLKKHDIEYEQLTAGEYKRTLTMFGENSDKARDKFKLELEETHVLFKSFIAARRPELDLEKVATGEHWFGTQAQELGLVDQISTSDDLIVAACQEKTVLALHYVQKKKLTDKLGGASSKIVDSAILKLAERNQKPLV